MVFLQLFTPTVGATADDHDFGDVVCSYTLTKTISLTFTPVVGGETVVYVSDTSGAGCMTYTSGTGVVDFSGCADGAH